MCGTTSESTELYASTLTPEAMTPEVFSARRLPDRIHYRLVKCRRCGLVRSDPVADPEVHSRLYANSSVEYGTEIPTLRQTYGYYLRELRRYGANGGQLLEIGCGNGFFLEEALDQGYAGVRGVELSIPAVESATPTVRDKIVTSEMTAGLFETGIFDVVCLFQVLDHIFSPVDLLANCRDVLKPGGFVLCLNHNVDAVSARLLGELSPIFDVEHTYLYSPRTARLVFDKAGLHVRRIFPAWNTYTLRYTAHLAPAPAALKRQLLAWLDRSWLGSLTIRVPAGNMVVVAQKSIGP